MKSNAMFSRQEKEKTKKKKKNKKMDSRNKGPRALRPSRARIKSKRRAGHVDISCSAATRPLGPVTLPRLDRVGRVGGGLRLAATWKYRPEGLSHIAPPFVLRPREPTEILCNKRGEFHPGYCTGAGARACTIAG